MSSPDSGARPSLQEAIEASNKSHHKSSPSASLSDSHFFTSLKSTVFPTFQRARPYFPDAQNIAGGAQAEDKRRLAYEKLLSAGILDGPRLVKNSPFVVASGGLLTGGALGFIGSALQNAVQSHNYGWRGVFTRTGGTIWGFAIAGGLYGFIDTYVGNVREEDDAWNKFAGGCAAGFFLGMKGGSLPLAIGTCAFLGTPVALLKAQGGSLRGDGKYEHMSTNGQHHVRYKDMFVPSPEQRMLEKIERDERSKQLAEEMELAKKHSKTSPELRKIIHEKQKELDKIQKEVIQDAKQKH